MHLRGMSNGSAFVVEKERSEPILSLQNRGPCAPPQNLVIAEIEEKSIFLLILISLCFPCIIECRS
jgi:hypothetical protein